MLGRQKWCLFRVPLCPYCNLGLWAELKDQYSASVGSHQAQLLRQIWLFPVEEGENPNKRMAEIRSAHAQRNSSGENLSDKMLAYCMTLSLRESFTPIIQSLWLNKSLKSADVQAAIQMEWAAVTHISRNWGAQLAEQGGASQADIACQG